MTDTILAQLRGGQPVTVDLAQPLITYRLLIQTPEDAEFFEASIDEVIRREMNHSPGVVGGWSDHERARYGVQVVELEDPPEGYIRTGYTLSADRAGIITARIATSRPPVPISISRMQARMYLRRIGVRDDVDEMVAQSDDDDLKDYWADTSAFHRNHAKLAAFATAAGWTADQLDGWFIEAAKIT